MEVDTGEMPLQYRREQQELNYALKLDRTNSHPTKSILQRERLALNHKFTQENRPFCSRVKEFMDKHKDIKNVRARDLASYRGGISPPQ